MKIFKSPAIGTDGALPQFTQFTQFTHLMQLAQSA